MNSQTRETMFCDLLLLPSEFVKQPTTDDDLARLHTEGNASYWLRPYKTRIRKTRRSPHKKCSRCLKRSTSAGPSTFKVLASLQSKKLRESVLGNSMVNMESLIPHWLGVWGCLMLGDSASNRSESHDDMSTHGRMSAGTASRAPTLWRRTRPRWAA